MTGDLVYSRGGGSLAYQLGGDSLVYKSDKEPATTGGEIEVAVVSAQSEVGPIQGCGNHHDVVISIDGARGSNAGQASVKFAAAAKTLSIATTSSGCAYPENNPPMTLTVVATQQKQGKVFTTSVLLPNVATGTCQVVVSVGARNVLTGVSAS